MITGGAPIHRDTLEYLMSVQLPVMEMYGMSECSGLHSANALNSWRLGSVGKTLAGRKTKIVEPDESGEGEVSAGQFVVSLCYCLWSWQICMYGRHVFMGYLNNEAKTKEAIDDEGWLHSGDIGRVDEDGYLFITGRIKGG